MRTLRRLLAVAGTVLLVVAVLAAGLAVLTVLTAPLVIALELAALALVSGVVTRRRRSRRRRAAEPAATPPTAPSTASTGPEWSTSWATEPEPAEVPAVREKLTAVLSSWGMTGEAGEPTLLVVTEMLDNVGEHGHGPTGLVVRLVGEGVRVEVSDGSSDPPLLQPHDPHDPGGRGLVLIEGVALRWGWVDEPAGKTVWAVVPPGWTG
jgi:anti-sigma regulatory factor (Ser/Thr protein kinase)